MFKACHKDAARAFCWSWTLCVEISLLVHWKHHGVPRLFRFGEQKMDLFLYRVV